MTWAAVIGSPIDHSLSPILHRAAWDSIGLPADWTYTRRQVEEADLEIFLAQCDAECLGLSVTMPCKQAIIPLLDAVDPMADAIGAVNTVVHAGGLLTGFNTDVHGMVMALREARAAAQCPPPERATVLGARASASSALAALGTLGVTDISVAARRFGGAGSVVTAATRLGLTIEHVMWTRSEAVDASVRSADILISTMPAGVADELAWRIACGHLAIRPRATLLDIVYSPLTTNLVAAWRQAGGVVAHGLDMLLHQAALQVQLMTGRQPDLAHMRGALESALPALTAGSETTGQ